MTIVVDSGARLVLRCPDEIAEFMRAEVQRFARCFRSAWEAIPQKHVALLIELWRALPNGPRVSLLGDWLGRADYALADCRKDGLELNFSIDAMHCLPDNLVEVVIAHELGHSIISAVRERGLPEDLLGFAIVPLDDEERIVAKVLGAWHFSQSSLDRWIAENAGLAFMWHRKPICTLGNSGSEPMPLAKLADRVLRAALESGSLEAAKLVLGGS